MTRLILSRAIDAALLACAAWCFATGCGSQVAERGTTLECHALECPSDEDAAEAVAIFSGWQDLDRDGVITVEWHAEGETFAEWQTEDGATHKALGLTLSPDRIQVSSWSLTAHELEHLRHWRADGDPDDANHAGPPGPWTAGDNLIVAAVTAEYAETFGEQ